MKSHYTWDIRCLDDSLEVEFIQYFVSFYILFLELFIHLQGSKLLSFFTFLCILVQSLDLLLVAVCGSFAESRNLKAHFASHRHRKIALVYFI